MSKKVVGVYATESEVIEAVNRLKKEGHTPDGIAIIANENQETSLINQQTDVQSDSVSQENDEPDFWEKIKAAFSGDDAEEHHTSDYKSRLKKHGLSDSEAAEHDANIQDGKFVVLAPENVAGVGTHPDDTPAGAGIGTQPSGTADKNAPGLDDSPYADPSEVETPPRGEGTHRAGDPLKEPGSKQSASDHTEDEQTIRLREEELQVNKEEVQAGEASVKKTVHEETKSVDVPVSHEELHVERKPVSPEETEKGIDSEMKEETIRVPLKEEKIDVTKKPVVKEEVEISKRQVEETEHATEKVKREELDIEEAKNKTRGPLDNDR